MEKLWQVKAQLGPSKNRAKDIIDILFKNRGLTGKKGIEDFLSPQNPEKLSLEKVGINPKQVEKAVKIIKEAIEKKWKIIVYGDYDADGVCATAILWEVLYAQGADALPFIPKREEHGYGISQKGIDEVSGNCRLIITVDNGIVANKAINYAKSKGIKVIITDHHQPGKKLPSADAIVWTDTLSGAGVAWMLAGHLGKAALDLAAIGTIADMMPLVGPNRSIVKWGLEAINNSRRPGLLAMIAESGLKKGDIDSWHVGYILAPRLNAMGRLEHALDSLRLLCTRDAKKAKNLAFALGATNSQRQDLTLSTFQQAQELIKLKLKDRKLIIVAHESFNQGVIGLVAGKLVEEYYRPAIVISKGSQISKASVRSINGFNIIEFLRRASEIYEEIGGHPAAAGFSVKTSKLKLLEKTLEELSTKQITDNLLKPVVYADCQIDLHDIYPTLYSQIEKFKPFGIGNWEPIFTSSGVEVLSAKTVGNKGQHLKLLLRPNFEAIAFCKGDFCPQVRPGDKIDILYAISKNNWNGRSKLQLKIKDLKTYKTPAFSSISA